MRATDATIELFFKGRRIASHMRSYEVEKYVTKKEHMPQGHQAQAEWTPVRLVNWAKKTGPSTAKLVEEIMRRHVHPQQGFRGCLGILHLNRHYDDGRIEAACARALRMQACSYKSVAAILKNNLDREATESEAVQQALPLHGNVRGPGYYH